MAARPEGWHAYNRGQAAELVLFDDLLADLLDDIEEPLQVRGRPRVPLRAGLFMAIRKVHSQLSMRRAHGIFQDGPLGKVPHYNLPSTILLKPTITPLLRDLITKTALPLASLEDSYAIDSTGFRTTSFSPYCVEKHRQKTREHAWIKLHLCIGTRTHVITRVVVTNARGDGTGDMNHFPTLLDETARAGFRIERVMADKAYSSRKSHEAAHNHGAVAYIPFRSNARARRGGAHWWRAFHYFNLHRDEFNQRYHKRSNIESTIAAVKKKLGDGVKSKNRTAQENELLCKVIAYNITVLIHEMHAHGIDPAFTQRPTSAAPPTNEDAEGAREAPGWYEESPDQARLDDDW